MRKDSLRGERDEYLLKQEEIEARYDAADESVRALEEMLVLSYGELLNRALTDLPEEDAVDWFGNFGMNIDVTAQRATLGFGGGIELPKGHRIGLTLAVTPGEAVGGGVSATREISGVGPTKEDTVRLFASAGIGGNRDGVLLGVGGGVTYSKTVGGKRESKVAFSAFGGFGVQLGETPSIAGSGGVSVEIGKLSPEERELKYKEELEAARKDLLKKEYERIDRYVESAHAGETSRIKQEYKEAIKKALDAIYLRELRNAEATNAAMPKNFEFTSLEIGIIAGADARTKESGMPFRIYIAAVFSVDGKTHVTRFADPEHIMDKSSDMAIMEKLNPADGDPITAGEMTLTAPLNIDASQNMFSQRQARAFLDRGDEVGSRFVKVGEGGDMIRTKDGDPGVRLKRMYERSVAMDNPEKFKEELGKEFSNYLDIYNDKVAAAQVRFERIKATDTTLEDSYRTRMVLFNTPGITEVHIDPQAEGMVEIDENGDLIFDFSAGFPIITKEVFEFESENYGANTVNILTIRFNRHFTRQEIEATESHYYVIPENNPDVKSRAIKMTPYRAVERDLTMVEKAEVKGAGAYDIEYTNLYERSAHIDEMHNLFLEMFEGAEFVDPRFEYISEGEQEIIRRAVEAFIPDEGAPGNAAERRELIEKYFTLSVQIHEDHEDGVLRRLEPEDQLDLSATQIEETKALIQLIQTWYKDRTGSELNNYQLQYFLGQMVFETFYNIHRGEYAEWKTDGQRDLAKSRGGKPYFISREEVFEKPGTSEEKPRSRALSNPLYTTMQRYLAHLHSSARDMARGVAENYVNNHPEVLAGGITREDKIRELTESLVADTEGEVHRQISERLEIPLETAKEYCDYLAYVNLKANEYDHVITREKLSFTPEKETEILAALRETKTIQAFYDTYENIFEGSQADKIQDEDALLMTELNSSFASARHFKYGDWYIGGGRAVEALSTRFGGLRKTFKYDLYSDDPEEREKARAIMEYMRPMPSLGPEGREFNPMSASHPSYFFEEGGEEIKYEIELEEAGDRRISKREERDAAIQAAEALYQSLEVSYVDVKEYLSTPLGLKVLEWAGVFLNEEQAMTMFRLFEKVRTKPLADVEAMGPLSDEEKEAFIGFVNINRVLREVEYFNASPEDEREAFYTVGIGGETYETQVRYIPVENVDEGIADLTTAFEKIEESSDFDTNAEAFLMNFVGMEDFEAARIMHETDYKTGCEDALVNRGFTQPEIRQILRGLSGREDIIRQTIRMIALSDFTPLSKAERLVEITKPTSEISALITEENEKTYLNQVHSRRMPDGTVRDVIPVAFIFKSSDPDNVMITNVGGVSATGTFLRCGNWSVLAQEQMTLYVQEVKPTRLEGGGAAMERTTDVNRPETTGEYTRVSTMGSGSGRIKVTPPGEIPPGTGVKQDENDIGTDGADPIDGDPNDDTPNSEGGSTTNTDDPNRGSEGSSTTGEGQGGQEVPRTTVESFAENATGGGEVSRKKVDKKEAKLKEKPKREKPPRIKEKGAEDDTLDDEFSDLLDEI